MATYKSLNDLGNISAGLDIGLGNYNTNDEAGTLVAEQVRKERLKLEAAKRAGDWKSVRKLIDGASTEVVRNEASALVRNEEQRREFQNINAVPATGSIFQTPQEEVQTDLDPKNNNIKLSIDTPQNSNSAQTNGLLNKFNQNTEAFKLPGWMNSPFGRINTLTGLGTGGGLDSTIEVGTNIINALGGAFGYNKANAAEMENDNGREVLYVDATGKKHYKVEAPEQTSNRPSGIDAVAQPTNGSAAPGGTSQVERLSPEIIADELNKNKGMGVESNVLAAAKQKLTSNGYTLDNNNNWTKGNPTNTQYPAASSITNSLGDLASGYGAGEGPSGYSVEDVYPEAVAQKETPTGLLGHPMEAVNTPDAPNTSTEDAANQDGSVTRKYDPREITNYSMTDAQKASSGRGGDVITQPDIKVDRYENIDWQPTSPERLGLKVTPKDIGSSESPHQVIESVDKENAVTGIVNPNQNDTTSSDDISSTQATKNAQFDDIKEQKKLYTAQAREWDNQSTEEKIKTTNAITESTKADVLKNGAVVAGRNVISKAGKLMRDNPYIGSALMNFGAALLDGQGWGKSLAVLSKGLDKTLDYKAKAKNVRDNIVSKIKTNAKDVKIAEGSFDEYGEYQETSFDKLDKEQKDEILDVVKNGTWEDIDNMVEDLGVTGIDSIIAEVREFTSGDSDLAKFAAKERIKANIGQDVKAIEKAKLTSDQNTQLFDIIQNNPKLQGTFKKVIDRDEAGNVTGIRIPTAIKKQILEGKKAFVVDYDQDWNPTVYKNSGKQTEEQKASILKNALFNKNGTFDTMLRTSFTYKDGKLDYRNLQAGLQKLPWTDESLNAFHDALVSLGIAKGITGPAGVEELGKYFRELGGLGLFTNEKTARAIVNALTSTMAGGTITDLPPGARANTTLKIITGIDQITNGQGATTLGIIRGRLNETTFENKEGQSIRRYSNIQEVISSNEANGKLYIKDFKTDKTIILTPELLKVFSNTGFLPGSDQ